MLQSVRQILAKLNLVLSAVVFEILNETLIMVLKELSDVGLFQEIDNIGFKLSFVVIMSLLGLLIDLLLQLLLQLLLFDSLLLLLQALFFALVSH